MCESGSSCWRPQSLKVDWLWGCHADLVRNSNVRMVSQRVLRVPRWGVVSTFCVSKFPCGALPGSKGARAVRGAEHMQAPNARIRWDQAIYGYYTTSLAQRTCKYKVNLLGPLLKIEQTGQNQKVKRSIRFEQLSYRQATHRAFPFLGCGWPPLIYTHQTCKVLCEKNVRATLFCLAGPQIYRCHMDLLPFSLN